MELLSPLTELSPKEKTSNKQGLVTSLNPQRLCKNLPKASKTSLHLCSHILYLPIRKLREVKKERFVPDFLTCKHINNVKVECRYYVVRSIYMLSFAKSNYDGGYPPSIPGIPVHWKTYLILPDSSLKKSPV